MHETLIVALSNLLAGHPDVEGIVEIQDPDDHDGIETLFVTFGGHYYAVKVDQF